MEIKNLSDKAAIAFQYRTLTSEEILKAVAHIYKDSWRIKEICQKFAKHLDGSGAGFDGYDRWLEGLSCEVLQPGEADWQKGKMKVTISFNFEFIPDPLPKEHVNPSMESTPDSPLDEIRQMMHET